MSEPQNRSGSVWPVASPIDVLSINVGTQAIVGANTTVVRTLTVNGLKASTHYVLSVTKPTHQAGLTIGNARVSADNTLEIQYVNCTAAGITPTASESYAVSVFRTPTQTKNTQWGNGL